MFNYNLMKHTSDSHHRSFCSQSWLTPAVGSWPSGDQDTSRVGEEEGVHAGDDPGHQGDGAGQGEVGPGVQSVAPGADSEGPEGERHGVLQERERAGEGSAGAADKHQQGE